MDRAVWWSQWSASLRQKVDAAGLECIPWSYNDGGSGEAAIVNANTDGMVIIDPEELYEAQSAEVQKDFVDALLAVKSGPIGCACWYDPYWHPAYNFANLARVVDFWIPMDDYQDAQISPAAAFDTWDKSGVQAGKATIPWVSADKTTTAQFAEAVKLAEQRYGGVTIWAAHCLTQEQIIAIAP